MKRDVRKILVLCLFSIILVGFVAGIAAAADTTTQSSGVVNEPANQQSASQEAQTFGQGFLDWLTKTTFNISDTTKGLISKILLMILVVLFVFSILTFVPFIPRDKEYINWLISIIVGILSFIFVSPDNVRLILINYEGLGIMLTSLFPLLIILVFTYRLREQNASAASIINPALIIGFLIYVGLRWWNFKPVNQDLVPELKYLYPATFIATIIWLFFERVVSKWIFRRKLRGGIDEFKNMSDNEAALYVHRLEDLKKEAVNPEEIAQLDKRIKILHNILNYKGG